MAVADALSRAPVKEADNEIASLVEEHVQIFEEALQGSDKQIQRMRDETGKDPQLAALSESIRIPRSCIGRIALCLKSKHANLS